MTSGEKPNILVVDDEQQITRVLKTTLASHGYSIRTARDGDEAVQVIKEWSPDLLITDLRMPNMEKHLTGKDTEPYDLVTFKLHKSQLPVVEQALEIAGLMLGSDKSRGYCLEMICADFLAGAHADGGAPDVLLRSMLRLFELTPAEQQQEFLAQVKAAA